MLGRATPPGHMLGHTTSPCHVLGRTTPPCRVLGRTTPVLTMQSLLWSSDYAEMSDFLQFGAGQIKI